MLTDKFSVELVAELRRQNTLNNGVATSGQERSRQMKVSTGDVHWLQDKTGIWSQVYCHSRGCFNPENLCITYHQNHESGEMHIITLRNLQPKSVLPISEPQLFHFQDTHAAAMVCMVSWVVVLWVTPRLVSLVWWRVIWEFRNRTYYLPRT